MSDYLDKIRQLVLEEAKACKARGEFKTLKEAKASVSESAAEALFEDADELSS